MYSEVEYSAKGLAYVLQCFDE